MKLCTVVWLVGCLITLSTAQSKAPTVKPGWAGAGKTFLEFSQSAEPFFFIHLSDPQLGMYTNNADFVQDAANFEFVVENINRLKPAFVVVTGDLVNKPGDQAQIDEYFRILSNIDPSILVYSVSGNHDVGNSPTEESVAFYRRQFGPNFYSFSHGKFLGLVIDSSVIKDPTKAASVYQEQETWLKARLQEAKRIGVTHIAVFQHHPWFVKDPLEADQYANIPLERRTQYLEILEKAGVRYVFCGHLHLNAEPTSGGLQVVATAPVGMPLGGASSGIRVVIVRADAIEHKFYSLGQIPSQVELKPKAKSTE